MRSYDKSRTNVGIPRNIKNLVSRGSCSVRALRLGRGSRSVVRRGDKLCSRSPCQSCTRLLLHVLLKREQSQWEIPFNKYKLWL